MHVRPEHYEGISIRDLRRFLAELSRAKDNVSHMPQKSDAWANAAWAIAGIAATIATTAGTTILTGITEVITYPLIVASLALAAIAILCGVFHRKLNEEKQDERDRIVNDIEAMISEVKMAMVANDEPVGYRSPDEA
jgi:hypothetical protein